MMSIHKTCSTFALYQICMTASYYILVVKSSPWWREGYTKWSDVSVICAVKKESMQFEPILDEEEELNEPNFFSCISRRCYFRLRINECNYRYTKKYTPRSIHQEYIKLPQTSQTIYTGLLFAAFLSLPLPCKIQGNLTLKKTARRKRETSQEQKPPLQDRLSFQPNTSMQSLIFSPKFTDF